MVKVFVSLFKLKKKSIKHKYKSGKLLFKNVKESLTGEGFFRKIYSYPPSVYCYVVCIKQSKIKKNPNVIKPMNEITSLVPIMYKN